VGQHAALCICVEVRSALREMERQIRKGLYFNLPVWANRAPFSANLYRTQSL
jgi:hypothetical protein